MTDHHRPPSPADYAIPDTHLARAKRAADWEARWRAYDRIIVPALFVLIGVGGGLSIAAQLVLLP